MNTLSYYAELGRSLSAAELAKLAARRAVRLSRKVLIKARPCTEADILRTFGAKSREDLAEVAFASGHGAFCDLARREDIVEALGAVPGARERALARAERARARRFRIFEKEVSFGEGPIDWALDPVSGYRYAALPIQQLPVLSGAADPKYPWALGRLDQLVALGQGYWVEAEPSRRICYAEEMVAQTCSFLDANPVGVGIQWASAMEVSLRAANLAQALRMFQDAPQVREGAFLVRVLRALSDHAHFVEAHLENQSAVPNNHLVANYVGLWVVSVLFSRLPDAAVLASIAGAGLREQMAAQVHADGVSFEGSVPYHRLAVELFTLAHLVARDAGASLGQLFEQRLARMYQACAAWCSERGLAPQIGDNDSGRALPFADRDSLDHGYLAPLGAALFGLPTLRQPGDALCDEAAWLTGSDGARRFLVTPRTLPPPTFSSRLAGIHVLRGGGAVLTVRGGPGGQRGVGGHDHNDQLSFELHLGGVPVIVDVGTGTYTRDAAVRNRFRSTTAHNSVQVDGLEQHPFDPRRLFALPGRSPAMLETLREGPAKVELVLRLPVVPGEDGPLSVTREMVLHRTDRTLLICDVLLGKGVHTLVSRLHLPDEEARRRLASREEQARWQLACGEGDAMNEQVFELGPAEAPRAVVLASADLELTLEPSAYSPSYGEIRPAGCVTLRKVGELPSSLKTLVLFL